jgi:site-specific DNA recombinase
MTKDKRTKCIIYTRFSDRPDSKTSESCESQLASCTKWCNDNDYEIMGSFSDKGVSGKTPIDEREGLGQAFLALKQGYALVVYHWDRLARDRKVHFAIEGFIIGRLGHMISVMNGASTENESPEDELMRVIMTGLSSYQRQIMALRTSQAMKNHQRNGRRMGSVHPYGWRHNPTDPKLMVKDKKEQENIERIIELRESPMGWRMIAKTLTEEGIKPRGKQWHYSTIKNIYTRAKEV